MGKHSPGKAPKGGKHRGFRKVYDTKKAEAGKLGKIAKGKQPKGGGGGEGRGPKGDE